jgi:hypothetical protein
MPKLLNESELTRYLSDDEIKRRRNNARSIAAAGSWESELELRRQTGRYQSSHFHDRETAIIEHSKSWIPQSHSGKKRTSKPRNIGGNPIAGAVISYSIDPAGIYPLEKPLLYYVQAFQRNIITKSELLSLIALVKSQAVKGGEN